KGSAPKSPAPTSTHGSPHTTTTHDSPHTTTQPTHTEAGPKTTAAPPKTHEADHSAKKTYTSSTTTNSTRLNPIAQKIASKPQLSSKIGAMLPAGISLNQASKGFKNQGQ